MKNKYPFFYTLFLCLTFFSGVFSHLSAQTHTAKTVTVNSNCGGFYEYLPSGYAASTDKFPVIIAFHGAGSYGTGTLPEMNEVLREQAAYYINRGLFPTSFTVNGETSRFIVISPQLRAAPTPANIDGIITYVLNNYKADVTRVYLMGYSIGANHIIKYASSSLAAARRIAAMVPIAAYINPYSDAGSQYIAQAGTAFWAIHSNNDVNAPPTWSQNYVNKINSYSPAIPAIITRPNGLTHVQTDTFACKPSYKPNGKNIYEWMLNYRRDFPPIARAGGDVNITMPLNSVGLNGSTSTDPENGALTFSWRKTAGPSAFVLANANTATPQLSGLVAGNYDIELTVTDPNGLQGKDTVRISVINPFPNQLPNVIVGNDATIYLPQTSFVLNGTQSNDADGVIETYSWTKISGPTQYTLTNANTNTATVSNLRTGTYQFRLTVTDNEGGTNSATIQITLINPFPNNPPVANAGANQVITLPTNSVTVDGAGSSDNDGAIVNYEWKYVSGPAGYSITSPSSVSTGITNLSQGVYLFDLKVTDDSSAVSTDQVQITVNPAPLYVSKPIKVNLFGGTNPYNVGNWNNWNVGGTSLTNTTSQVLNYEDGTSSGVTAFLSFSQAVSDNGASYGGTMCPPEVLRYTSYATISPRTLRLNGLRNDRTYNLEFYASRVAVPSQVNSTRFTVNGQEQIVVTDVNKTNKASFFELVPVDGVLTISVSKVTTYSYLNGFILTENAPAGTNQAPVSRAGADVVLVLPQNAVTLNGSASSDADGTITSYVWTKFSGPATFTLSNPNISNPTFSGLVQGTYGLQLRVVDNNGASSLDTMFVSVSPSPFVAPIARAGADQSIYMPTNSVTVNGNTSSDVDGTITTYAWRKISGPNGPVIVSPSSASTVINSFVPGVFDFELLVTDNDNQTAKDTVRVTVGDDLFLPPSIVDQINCGKKVKVVVLGSSTAAGNGATPLDSSWANKFKAYLKSKNSTSDLINLATASRTTYDICNPTGYVPSNGRSAPDTFRNITKGLSHNPDLIIVNLPSNDAALNFTLAEQQDNFNRMMIEADARNVPVWVTTTQPRTSLNSTQRAQLQTMRDWILTRFGNKAIDFWNGIANADGTIISLYNADDVHVNNFGHHLLFTRVVGERILDSICLRSNNIAPTANAGLDAVISLPINTVTLTGTGADTDGTISSYSWSKISGPASGTIINANTANASAEQLVVGTYVFRLTVADNDGGVGFDDVQVLVNPAPNVPPVSIAGPDQTIILPENSVTLAGSGTDSDGSISSYFWQQVSGPSSASIQMLTDGNATAGALVMGTYIFRLSVTDNDGASAADSVQIVVEAPLINLPPTANAGADQTITLPVNSISLNGTAIDVDGSISGLLWEKVSGPAATLNNNTSANASASGLLEGVYIFRLTVTDNDNATASDELQVTVLPEPPNVPPTADAGADRSITLPTNTVTLSGSAADTDGTISSVWSQIAGPTTAGISNVAILNPTISGLSVGIYQFQLTVTDDDGAVATDIMAINVNPEPNTPPVVNAGSDIVLTLPVNTTTLNGNATDAQSNITGYSWTKISGPTTFTFGNAASSSTSLSNLVQGVYVFRLTVTDAQNATGTDDVSVTVNPEPPLVTRQRVLIDLGPANTNYGKITVSPDAYGKYWNNVTDARAGVRLTNAVDSANATTGIGFEVINRIDGTFSVNGNGMNYGNPTTPVGDYPGTAVEDNAFAHSSTTTGRWRIYGLDPTRTYSFKFWGNRSGTGSRIVQIKLSTDATWVQEFNAINNTDYNRAAFLNNVTGVTEAIFDIRCKPGQTYGNISVIDIVSIPTVATYVSNTGISTIQTARAEKQDVVNTSNDGVSVYPNPTTKQCKVLWDDDYRGNVEITLVDATGKILVSYQANKQQRVLQQEITMNGTAGVYWIMIKANGISKRSRILKLPE